MNHIDQTLRVHGNHEKSYQAKIRTNPPKPTNSFTENYNTIYANPWVIKHQKKYQPALEELLGKVKRISYDSFVKQLGASTKDAVSQVGVNSQAEYTSFLNRAVVLVEDRKSNQWVAEVARRKLGFKPQRYYRLGSKDANKFVDHITSHASGSEKGFFQDKVIVLFDDGSYSGKQITDHVTALLGLRNQINFDKICLIVPYMTDHAKSGLEKVIKETDSAGRVVISKAAKIDTVAESVSKKNAKLLTELWWSKEPADKGANSKGVIWFDHKIPNDQSFIGAIEKGNVINEEKVCKQKFKILPEIKVPYKQG